MGVVMGLEGRCRPALKFPVDGRRSRQLEGQSGRAGVPHRRSTPLLC